MIADLIRRAAFSSTDIKFGTEGQCASFALALHRLLKSIAIKSTPALCVPLYNGKPEMCRTAPNEMAWYHAIVICQSGTESESYVDIKGPRSLDAIKCDFQHWFISPIVQGVYPITEEQLVKEIFDVKKNDWNRQPYGYGDRLPDRSDEWFKKLKDCAYE